MNSSRLFSENTLRPLHGFFLALLLSIFMTACGNVQSETVNEAEGRIAPYMERSQIRDNWDLILYYHGMVEDCVGLLTASMSEGFDEIEDVFVTESDEEASDREFLDLDFLTYSSMSLYHWMAPLNGVKLTPFQEKSNRKIKAAYEKVRGCKATITSRKDGDYIYFDVMFDLPDKEGTWHSCKEVQCFSVKNGYWASEKHVDGNLIGFYGFRWLGGNTYAFSSNYVRGIMVYDDKRHVFTELNLSAATQAIVLLEEYAGHSFNFDDPYEFGWEDRFDSPSADWVTEGEDRGGIFRHFQYDGNKLTISGLARTLEGVKTKDARFDANYEIVIHLDGDGQEMP